MVMCFGRCTGNVLFPIRCVYLRAFTGNVLFPIRCVYLQAFTGNVLFPIRCVYLQAFACILTCYMYVCDGSLFFKCEHTTPAVQS